MFAVAGDETGLVKLVDLNNRTYLRFGDRQNRDLAVCGLVCPTRDCVLSLNKQGIIQKYAVSIDDPSNYSMNRVADTVVKVEKPIGMSMVSTINHHSHSQLLTYNAEGALSILDTLSLKELSAFNVRGPVGAAATAPGGRALFGGKENDVLCYDLSTQTEVWKAKNVSQDKLHLRVPVWITSIAFKHGISSTFSAVDAQPQETSVFYTGTAYRQVRMYDMQAGQQPICSFEIGADYRVASILPAKCGDSEHQLYVADTAGNLMLWDLRTQRRLATLKGAAGSLRSLTLSADGGQLAAVGLDRFLRLYDTADGSLRSAVYLKNRLTSCVLVGSSDGIGRKVFRKEGRGKAVRVENEGDEDVLLELRADSDSYSDSDSDSEGSGEGGSEGRDGEGREGSACGESDDEGEESQQDGDSDSNGDGEGEYEDEGDGGGSGRDSGDSDDESDSEVTRSSDEEEEEDELPRGKKAASPISAIGNKRPPTGHVPVKKARC